MASRRLAVYPGMCAALLIGCSNRGSEAGAMLARAASLQRSVDVRFPGAEYREVSASRSSRAAAEGTAELAEAEAAILRQLRDRPNDRQALKLYTRVHILRGRWPEALAAAARVQDARPGPDSDLAGAYLARGLALGRARDLLLAVEQYGALRGEESSSLDVLYNRTVAYERLFLYRSAAKACDRYLAADGNSKWADEVRGRQQRVRTRWEDWSQRLSSQEQSTPAAFLAQRSTEAERPETYLDSALAEWLPLWRPDGHGDADQALRALAARLIETHRDRWLAGVLSAPFDTAAAQILARAVKDNREARRESAARRAAEALRLFGSQGNAAGVARARLELIFALSRSFRAADCLRESARLNSDIRGAFYTWIETQLAIEGAVCAFHAGYFGRTMQEMDAANAIASKSGYESLRLRALGIAASFYRQLGDPSNAAQSSLDGLALFWAGQYTPLRAYQFYSELFLCAEREEQWEAAEVLAAESVGAVERGPNRVTEAAARSRLAAILLHLRRNADAAAEAARADAMFAEFRADPAHREFDLSNAVALAEAHLAAGELGEARRALGGRGDSGAVSGRLNVRRVEALMLDKEGRSEAAVSKLREAAALAASLTGSLVEDAARLRWKAEAGRAIRKLVELELDAGRHEAALAVWEWFRSAPVRGSRLPRIDGIEAALKASSKAYNRASVVSWFAAGDRLGVWLFDDRGARFAWSPATLAQCRAEAEAFHRLCSRRDSDLGMLRESGRRLYTMLLGGIEQWLDPKRVLLAEPDKVPGAIAFEALVSATGRWLGEEFVVVVSPGVWAELALRPLRKPVTSQTDALIVGNPAHQSDGGLGPLPDAEHEARMVASLMPASRLLLGAAATPTAVIDALHGAPLFHYAGHARSDGASGWLLLAGRQAVAGATAIEKAAEQCRLAVLSACSTAAGERIGPWNVESFVQALWRAGTPDIVASRWDVDSPATSELMRNFYHGLLRKDTPWDALAAAAHRMRTVNVTAHPYYWAAFGVFGCAPAAGS